MEDRVYSENDIAMAIEDGRLIEKLDERLGDLAVHIERMDKEGHSIQSSCPGFNYQITEDYRQLRDLIKKYIDVEGHEKRVEILKNTVADINRTIDDLSEKNRDSKLKRLEEVEL